MYQYKVIVNPIAGRGAGERAIPLIKQLLKGYGLDFDLIRTERPWHAAELAQQAVADGYEVVVAVGGDGTANEVLNGLMLAKQAGLGTATMGYISVGRGNDFGFGVGVPAGVEAGCKVLQQGYRRLIDVGRVEGGLYPQGRYFGNGVGIGFDAVVGFEAVKMKYLTGFPNYLVAALKTIFLYYRAPQVQIEYNEEDITQLSLMISIMNGRRMGGAFMMAPQAQIDDGLLDLCIAAQTSRPRIFALIPQFMKGTQSSQPEIKTARTNRIVVTALEGVLPAHADGETLCTEGKRLAVELLPRQIEIICQVAEATS
nr:diacylglycerol kinase family lipid kinase [Chloroflexota bacterium]